MADELETSFSQSQMKSFCNSLGSGLTPEVMLATLAIGNFGLMLNVPICAQNHF